MIYVYQIKYIYIYIFVLNKGGSILDQTSFWVYHIPFNDGIAGTEFNFHRNRIDSIQKAKSKVIKEDGR